ncbi:CHAD domain-containing protein [Anaeromyxobacter terrae]|uniref:CHAD domain-containing protein n=1 Tax=Anaeromyxobacter terrae TaxID=2925406 RepID=UPI001F59F176|nr:CHAD domain-containing protein [Anaeromyxobacter sp. SG22]
MAKPTEIPGLEPGTPVSVAGPLLVRARLDDVRRYEAAALGEGDGEPDVDAVHDMRIATRRLRAAIQLFGRGELAALEGEVKALQDALGEVRDGQVQRRWFARHARKEGGAGRLATWAGAGLPKAAKRLRRALRAWQGAVAPSIARAAEDAAGKGRLEGKRLAKEVTRRLRTVNRRLADAHDARSPRKVHRLRIAAKKLRYAAELVDRGFPDAATRMLAALVPLQERLGDLHDTDVRIERLERLARRGGRGERRAARATLAVLREERDREARALRRELSRWREEGVVRALRRGFSGGGGRRVKPGVDGAAGANRHAAGSSAA